MYAEIQPLHVSRTTINRLQSIRLEWRALRHSENTMTILSLFGLCAVSAAVFFYAMENFSHWFVLALAVANALAGVYAFIQGAWPYGLVEIVWTLVGLWRWGPKRRLRLKAMLSDNDERCARGKITRDKYLHNRNDIDRQMINIQSRT
jgi:hypothetical protein